MNTKSTQSILLFTLLIALSGLACKAAASLGTPTPAPVTPVPSSTPLPPTATLIPPTATVTPVVVCSDVLSSIMNLVSPNGNVADDLRGKPDPEDNDNFYVLNIYQVNFEEIKIDSTEAVPDTLLEYQEQEDVHQEIWDFYTRLIPKEHRSMIDNFVIITDGKHDILAAVQQTDYNPNKWALEVDILDIADKKDLTYTLIHEFGHLLTLNSKQVTPSLPLFDDPNSELAFTHESMKCDQFFTREGCSQPDSYINAFYEEFWADLYAEWDDTYSNDDDQRYDNLNEFYHKYQDQFVTDYASVHPVEDMAESFSFFILAPKPEGKTIADQKILFFYNYPELVTLRDDIQKRICSLNP